MDNLDQLINDYVAPLAKYLNDFIGFRIPFFGSEMPIIVIWLIAAALFFTIYFRFLNITGFIHAIRLVKGDFDKPEEKGEISHFQALATALSGTVGIGNIAGVAVVISMGGPGALFWLVVAGFLSMSTKFVECVLGVKYRKENPDGSVSGGPMYYLERGFKERGLGVVAKPIGIFYAISIVIGCLGIGNMFQSNQAFEQIVFLAGPDSFWSDKGWLFGLIFAVLVALVILGGIKSIAKVTSKVVPFMAIVYLFFGLLIIAMNYDKIPWAVSAVISNAFTPQAGIGGMVGVMILGFQRALFSNEAGLGSAAIAHSAVQTDEPVTEGFVGLLEPFIDTVVICSITALVILTTVYDPSAQLGADVKGVELTASAFKSTISWSVYPLAIVAILFAFSTIISWSYYGLKAWTYIFGESLAVQNIFKFIFCFFVAVGCMIQLQAVLDFSDAMIYIVAIPNIIGLYILAPIVKRELVAYRERLAARQ